MSERISVVSVVILAILVLIALPANAAITATNVEVRGKIWNESSPVSSWTPQNFPGFFYDLNDNLGTENITISQSDLSWPRVIYKSNLIYTTIGQPKMLNVVKYAFGGNLANAQAAGLQRANPGQAFENGNYYSAGWQGERYVAINGKIDKLSRLVLEHGNVTTEKKTLTVNETWNIGGGWTLTVNSINTSSTPKQARLFLRKDGIKKNETVLFEKKIYTYVEKNVTNETDIPLFVTYADSIFHSGTSDFVQLRYTWAVSTTAMQINSSDTYGVFANAHVVGRTLYLSNTDTSVALLRNTIVDLIGSIKFKVADSDTLRFYPVILRTEPGIYEVRGSVWNESSPVRFWNPVNFAGLFYDSKDNLGTENITIMQSNLSGSQRTIYKTNLIYTTTAQPKMLNVVDAAFGGDLAAAQAAGLEGINPGQMFGNGNYYIAGWQSEKYVAINRKVDKLTKLVLEQGTSATDKKILIVGDVWELGDGWTLKANSVDLKATPRQVRFTLSKDGIIKDERVASSGYGGKPIYTFVEASLADETDVPVFVTYVDNIFSGETSDMVQLRYTWLISESVTQIKSTDNYGIFKNAQVAGNTLSLSNTDTAVSLTRNSTVDIMGDLKFKVADSNTLRFYPFAMYTIPLPPPPPRPFDTLRFEPKAWNLVSVPKTLVNSSVNVALSNLSSDVNNVKWYYNASSNAWERPSSIEPLRGYWVYNNASTKRNQTLYYKSAAGPNLPPSMVLRAGWNLIGHTSTTPMPVQSALISIEGKYSNLLTYDPVEGWKMYIVGNPSLQQFNVFEPGKGYWIFMTQDATYAAVDV